jgi:hypothetical protein
MIMSCSPRLSSNALAETPDLLWPLSTARLLPQHPKDLFASRYPFVSVATYAVVEICARRKVGERGLRRPQE